MEGGTLPSMLLISVGVSSYSSIAIKVYPVDYAKRGQYVQLLKDYTTYYRRLLKRFPTLYSDNITSVDDGQDTKDTLTMRVNSLVLPIVQFTT